MKFFRLFLVFLMTFAATLSAATDLSRIPELRDGEVGLGVDNTYVIVERTDQFYGKVTFVAHNSCLIKVGDFVEVRAKDRTLIHAFYRTSTGTNVPVAYIQGEKDLFFLATPNRCDLKINGNKVIITKETEGYGTVVYVQNSNDSLYFLQPGSMIKVTAKDGSANVMYLGQKNFFSIDVASQGFSELGVARREGYASDDTALNQETSADVAARKELGYRVLGATGLSVVSLLSINAAIEYSAWKKLKECGKTKLSFWTYFFKERFLDWDYFKQSFPNWDSEQEANLLKWAALGVGLIGGGFSLYQIAK